MGEILLDTTREPEEGYHYVRGTVLHFCNDCAVDMFGPQAPPEMKSWPLPCYHAAMPVGTIGSKCVHVILGLYKPVNKIMRTFQWEDEFSTGISNIVCRIQSPQQHQQHNQVKVHVRVEKT